MSHEDSKQHLFAKLMQPCLVPLRDGRVVDVGSERNQKSIELNTTCFPTRCLAINHLVVHVAQVSKTIPRTDPPLVGVTWNKMSMKHAVRVDDF